MSDTSRDGSFTFISKWINASDRSVEHPFEQVYEAVDTELKGWDPARKVAAERLQVSDIVVVECYVKRFKHKPAVATQRGWVSWGVNFELIRIAQLLVGPGVVDDPPPECAANI